MNSEITAAFIRNPISNQAYVRCWQMLVFAGYFVATQALHMDFRVYMALVLAAGLLLRTENTPPLRTSHAFSVHAIVPLAAALFLVDSLFL